MSDLLLNAARLMLPRRGRLCSRLSSWSNVPSSPGCWNHTGTDSGVDRTAIQCAPKCARYLDVVMPPLEPAGTRTVGTLKRMNSERPALPDLCKAGTIRFVGQLEDNNVPALSTRRVL